MLLLSNLALLLALLANPWLLARNLHRRADALTTLAIAGVCAVSLGILGPLSLHLARIPISPASLSAFHGVIFLMLAGLSALRSIHPLLPAVVSRGGPASPLEVPHPLLSPAGMALVFCLLIIPFTPMAGRDTYKYQDLASVVQVDRAITWLIHPLSLFGFTPRSYSSAQPLLLSSIAIMSGAGVGVSFYILSVLCGLLGLAAVSLLARHLFPDKSTAAWMTFFYVFSLVFLRYNFWAIGRGLFLDILPLFVFGLLNLHRFRAILGTAWCALLLCMSHKTGLIAVLLLPAAFLAGVLLLPPCRPAATQPRFPPLWRILLPCLLFLAALVAGYLVAGQSLAHALVRGIPRLSVLFPLAFIGACFVLAPPYGRPAARAMTMAALAFLPMVFTDDMYGALIAVLFIAFLAAAGMERLVFLIPGRAHNVLRNTAFTAVLLPAVTIIVYQSTDSPSWDVVRAARFLNRHDPLGPYRIEAPGATRPRMQAYLDGCPRFNVTDSFKPPTLRPPPPLRGPLRTRAQDITSYLRCCLALPEASTDWYGNSKKVYYVTEGNQGMIPKGSRRLFTSGNVSVYEPPEAP